ncbi:ABC transporter ATP-binding protein [Helicobacter sp. 23-1045]
MQKNTQKNIQNIIEVRNLYTKYKDTFIQENVSFSVAKSEIFGILGGSGSGKSTLLSAMIRLKKPESGSIRIFGEDIWQSNSFSSNHSADSLDLERSQTASLVSHPKSSENYESTTAIPSVVDSANQTKFAESKIKIDGYFASLVNPTDYHDLASAKSRNDNVGEKILNRCGVLFQFGALFSSLSVLDNVGIMLEEYSAYPKRVINEIAAYYINAVGLPQSVKEMYPYELSGGMKKRVGLARALVYNPEILFLDEPTSGLDPKSAENFDKLIKRLKDEFRLTIVMITHDLDSIKDATDRFILLDSGKVLFEGSLEDFKMSEVAHKETLLKSKRGERLWREG